MPKLNFLIGAVVLLGACVAPICPKMMETGETGRVVRVLHGDALILNTGQSVKLLGLEVPKSARGGRPAQLFGEESRRYLEDLALGRAVQLCYPGLTRDRYDRALAHAFTHDDRGPPVWLNRASLEAGMARARFYPDSLAVSETLLRVEAEAIDAQRGLWRKSDYRIKTARDVAIATTGFTLVIGVLGPIQLPASAPQTRDFACLRTLKNASLSVRIQKAANTLCRVPAGGRYILRGWVTQNELELTLPEHAQQIGPAPDPFLPSQQ